MGEKPKEKKKVEVALIEQGKQVAEVGGFISKAIDKGVDVATMEKLFALREKVRAEEAREAFVGAMASFQSECPIIEKNKTVLNKDGRTVRYKYASLDTIVEKMRDPLSKYGLAYSWKVKNEEGFITAIATITHKFGHSETSEFKVPVDKEGYMTEPQKYASALTFAKRYALINALGISTGEEDTDATDVGKEGDAKSDKSKIMFLLRNLNVKTEKKEQITEAIKRLTKKALTEKNYPEIISRLEILVKEAREYENQKV